MLFFKCSFQKETEKPVNFSIQFGLFIYGILINPQGIITVVLYAIKMQYLNSSRKEFFYVVPPIIPSKGTALYYYHADLKR